MLQEAFTCHVRLGKHLLTELVTDTYIPNDTNMTAHSGRVQACPAVRFVHSIRG